MNRANLYQDSNEMQRQDAKQILNEYSELFQWRNDGQDSLLDIGCGSGDVTIDFILPILPPQFTQLVGSDISEQMIRYARKTYCNSLNGRISFRIMDIGGDITPINYNEFDHITSFYCLHWVQNQLKALKNIYNLLRNDGNCLLVFLAKNPIFDIYNQMSKSRKWKNFMTDVKRFISPYQFSENPAHDFGVAMYSAGFTNIDIEVRDRVFIFNGAENLRKSVQAVNPFLDRIPENMHEEFFEDYVKVTQDMKLEVINETDVGFETKYLSPYKLVICFAKK